MKIVIPGGSGQVGALLARAFRADGHHVIILTRAHAGGAPDAIAWDAKTLGPWTDALDGADAVINLAGRSVDCRYTADNRREIMDSRLESTAVLREAILQADAPPRRELRGVGAV